MPDMMKLKELTEKQKELSIEIELAASALSRDEYLLELENGKTEAAELRREHAELNKKLAGLTAENSNLKEGLKQLAQSEKSRFLSFSSKKMSEYFRSETGKDINRLVEFERTAQKNFEESRRILQQEYMRAETEFSERLTQLKNEIDETAAKLKQQYDGNVKAADKELSDSAAKLREQEIKDETVDKLLKETNVERVIGLNVLGKAGIVLILVAVIFLSQFAYGFFNTIFKCVFLFSLASVVLGLSQLLQYKKPSVFSISIVALGISLEYAALSISYFSLRILNVYLALGLCLVITATAYLLSVRWKSQTVAAFAQVGGYLPLIAVFGDLPLIYGAMIYFLLLNTLCFLLSLKFKWTALTFIGFALNLAGIVVLAVSTGLLTAGKPFGTPQALTLVFILVSFALYTLLPVFTNYKKRFTFSKRDFILIAINTTLTLLAMNILFYVYGIGDYTGYLSLFYAACYFALYFGVRKLYTAEKRVSALFWLTGFTFIALFPPLHFGVAWMAFGWLIEATVLLLYGILRGDLPYFRIGAVIGAASLSAFTVYDIIFEAFKFGDPFLYKYMALTLCSIALLGSLIYKRYVVSHYSLFPHGDRNPINVSRKQTTVFTVAAYANAALFFIYLITKICVNIAKSGVSFSGNNYYLIMASMIFSLFLLAVLIPKIKPLRFLQVYICSLIIAAAALTWLLVLNCLPLLQLNAAANFSEKAAATAMVTVITLLSVFVLYDGLMKLRLLTPRGSTFTAVIFSVYSLLCLTLILLVQYRLPVTNISISISYILTSLLCIIFGFYKRNIYTRRFALGLAVLALVKLCIVDSLVLGLVYRIISYFVFGIVLIGMSLVYQIFIKKFEPAKAGGKSGNKPDKIGEGSLPSASITGTPENLMPDKENGGTGGDSGGDGISDSGQNGNNGGGNPDSEQGNNNGGSGVPDSSHNEKTGNTGKSVRRRNTGKTTKDKINDENIPR